MKKQYIPFDELIKQEKKGKKETRKKDKNIEYSDLNHLSSKRRYNKEYIEEKIKQKKESDMKKYHENLINKISKIKKEKK